MGLLTQVVLDPERESLRRTVRVSVSECVCGVCVCACVHVSECVCGVCVCACVCVCVCRGYRSLSLLTF